MDTDDTIPLMTDQERREMIAARMLPEDGPLSEPQIAEVRKAVCEYIDKHKITRKQLALHTGRSAPVISDFLTGRYAGREDEVARDLNGWMEMDARRRRERREANFTWTSVADAMMAVATKCAETNAIGLAYGCAGIGKTLTAQVIAGEIRKSVYVLIGADDAGVSGLRDALYEAVTQNKRTAKKIREQLGIYEQLAGSDRLLIVDQAHKLSQKALEYLFDLHDRTNCPILFVGTLAIRDRLSAGSDHAWGQLYSRVSFRCNLLKQAMGRNDGPLFTVDEVRRIFQRGKVRLSAGGAKFLTDQACIEGRGCLRLAARLVFWADRICRRREKLSADDVAVITDEHLEAAIATLDDDDRANRMVRTERQEPARQAATA